MEVIEIKGENVVLKQELETYKKKGGQPQSTQRTQRNWIPVFTGMTNKKDSGQARMTKEAGWMFSQHFPWK